MQYYGEIFSTVLFALEEAFVIELYKFFDTRRDALKLVSSQTSSAGVGKDLISKEDRARIEQLVTTNKHTIDHIGELRHNLFAHDKKDIDEKEWRMPSINSLDQLFEAIKEIHNIISKANTGDYWAWRDDDGKNMNWLFSSVLADLKGGHEKWMREQEEKWRQNYAA